MFFTVDKTFKTGLLYNYQVKQAFLDHPVGEHITDQTRRTRVSALLTLNPLCPPRARILCANEAVSLMWRPECSGAVVPVPTPTSGPTLGATPPRRKPICALTAECGVCAAGKIQFAKETAHLCPVQTPKQVRPCQRRGGARGGNLGIPQDLNPDLGFPPFPGTVPKSARDCPGASRSFRHESHRLRVLS